tara:strand:+ start:796 stop:2085 length:1290 start_codon:yes stop_codon:yes gene_type:complete
MNEFVKNLTAKKKIFLRKLIIFYFFYVLLEGALRKWVLPNLATEIILVRDFLVIFIIMQGFTNKLYNFNSYLEKSALIWTVLVLFWIVLQHAFIDIPAGVSFIGFRCWVLYIWFSVLIFRIFNNFNEMNQFIDKIIYSLIPISLLVLVQHYLPPEHLINKQTGTGYIFTIANDIVRVTGTFSFTFGQVQYMAFITPFFLYFILERNKQISLFIKIILSFSFLTCVFVSGARGTILYVSFMIFFALCFNKTNKSFITSSLILLPLVLICFFVFERAIDATLQRFAVSGDASSSIVRLINAFLPDMSTWRDYSTLGRGIGFAANMSRIYLGEDFRISEHESDSIIVEGGILGVIFLFIKILIATKCVSSAIKIYQNFYTALPLYLSIYFFIQILINPITKQITTHAFTFLSLGLLLVALNHYSKEKNNNYL